jgi:hypothetical protein
VNFKANNNNQPKEDNLNKLKEENSFLFEENNKMKLLFLKTLTQIQMFENEENIRDKEANVKSL